MFFKLKPRTGNHSQIDKDGKSRVYTAAGGEIIESDSDLEKMFPNKFERLDVPQVNLKPEKPKEEKVEDEEETPEPTKTEEKAEEKHVSFGKDATDKFPYAKEEDFKVFYKAGRGGGFTVTESENTSKALNSELLKKDAVDSFIKDYLKNE